MLEEVVYETLPSHQKIYHAFSDKIKTLQTCFNQGDYIVEELAGCLQKWLINHIFSADVAYCELVQETLLSIESNVKKTGFKKQRNGFFLDPGLISMDGIEPSQ